MWLIFLRSIQERRERVFTKTKITLRLESITQPKSNDAPDIFIARVRSPPTPTPAPAPTPTPIPVPPLPPLSSQNLLSDPEVDLTAVSSPIQRVGEAFGVDPSDDVQSERLSIKPPTLETVFDLPLKTRDEVTSSSAPPKPASRTAEDKANADKLKQEGNALMSGKNYDEAIETYTKAIELDSTNPDYYYNRATAHSSKGDYLSATSDAEKAIEVDPSYVKAYYRLG